MTGADASILELMEQHDGRLGLLALEAERYLDTDPAIAVIKFRVFGELLVGEVGRINSRHRRGGEPTDRFINRLASSRFISEKAAKRFHEIRKIGNAAAHGKEVTHGDALEAAKSARVVSTWFLSRYSKEIFEEYNPQKRKVASSVGDNVSTPIRSTQRNRKFLSRAELLAVSIRKSSSRAES